MYWQLTVNVLLTSELQQPLAVASNYCLDNGAADSYLQCDTPEAGGREGRGEGGGREAGRKEER